MALRQNRRIPTDAAHTAPESFLCVTETESMATVCPSSHSPASGGHLHASDKAKRAQWEERFGALGTKRCLELCRTLNCAKKVSIGAGLSVGVCSVGWCEGGGVTRNGIAFYMLYSPALLKANTGDLPAGLCPPSSWFLVSVLRVSHCHSAVCALPRL